MSRESIKDLIFENPYREPQKPGGRDLDVEISLSIMIETVSNAQQECQIFTELEPDLGSDHVRRSFQKVLHGLVGLYQINVSTGPLKTNKVDKESVLSRVTHEGYHMTGLENRLFQLIEHITKVLRQFRILSSDHPELQDEKLVQEMTLLVRFMKNERNDLISSWGY